MLNRIKLFHNRLSFSFERAIIYKSLTIYLNTIYNTERISSVPSFLIAGVSIHDIVVFKHSQLWPNLL